MNPINILYLIPKTKYHETNAIISLYQFTV